MLSIWTIINAKYRVFKSGEVGGHESPSSYRAGFRFDRTNDHEKIRNTAFFWVRYDAVLSKQGERNWNAVFA
jgi:hypothetical protein